MHGADIKSGFDLFTARPDPLTEPFVTSLVAFLCYTSQEFKSMLLRRTLGVSDVDPKQWDVSTEYTMRNEEADSHSRPDIVLESVRFDGRRQYVIIENKCNGADLTPNQKKAVREDLWYKWADKQNGCVIKAVFLTRDSRRPLFSQGAPIPAQYGVLPMTELVKWTDELCRRSEMQGQDRAFAANIWRSVGTYFGGYAMSFVGFNRFTIAPNKPLSSATVLWDDAVDACAQFCAFMDELLHRIKEEVSALEISSLPTWRTRYKEGHCLVSIPEVRHAKSYAFLSRHFEVEGRQYHMFFSYVDDTYEDASFRGKGYFSICNAEDPGEMYCGTPWLVNRFCSNRENDLNCAFTQLAKTILRLIAGDPEVSGTSTDIEALCSDEV